MENGEDISSWAGFFSYIPTKPFQWLLNSPCKITCMFTGNQFGKNECVTSDTLIDTPSGKYSMGHLYDKGEPFDVYSWDGSTLVIARATAPVKKDARANIYEITLSDGQWVRVSSDHRILTADGVFCSVDCLYDSFHKQHPGGICENDYQVAGELFHQPTTLESSLVIHSLGDLRCEKTRQGCQGDYPPYLHLGDERLLWEEDSVRSFVPLPSGVQQRISPHAQRKGVAEHIYANILRLKRALLSNLYVYYQNAALFFESLTLSSCTTFQQLLYAHQGLMRPQPESLSQPQSSSLMHHSKNLNGTSYYTPPLCFNGNTVVSIKSIGSQEVFDITVEKYHNYLAGGMIHHNCGVMDYTFSILGWHPNKSKNVSPEDTVRTFRFASNTLPSENETDEVKNTQYPAFKRRFPLDLIEKDITARKPVVTVKTPDGKNLNIEYVSFGQEIQSGAGVQRKRIWIDEECSEGFFEEQLPRLLAANGDILFTFTPVPGSIGWMFDTMYERAKYIYRTEAVRERIKERTGEVYPECEITDSTDDICVIMAATDDNPIYENMARKISEQTGKPITAKEYIDSMFDMYDDEDVIDARRYGLFRQLSGKIHKSFTPNTHVISYAEYFPKGVPFGWKHFRGIDYHNSNPWACVWLSVSPDDEIFVWCDHSGNIQRKTSYDIGLEVAQRSGDYKYTLDLIDPLANSKQTNTNLSTIEDLNRYFIQFKREGIGTGGHWMPWDTKGSRGREEMTKRLLNSLKVGKPFNNKVIVGDRSYDRTQLLPTIWITDNCRNLIESIKNWRLEEWGTREMLSRNDPKEVAQQRWSHFPISVECLLKNPMVSNARWGSTTGEPLRPKSYLTQGRRR